MSLDKIEKIKKIKDSAKAATPEITPEQQRLAPNKEHFDKLMLTEKTTTQKAEPGKNSLMDEIRALNTKVDGFSKASPRALVAQADEVIHQIETLKDKLATPNLELKTSTQTMLNNKLSHIDENLRIALTKAGLEYAPADKTPAAKAVNPIERFLGFLTHGQDQLKTISHEVELMHLNRKEITPANMLRIQMKVGAIQQEIEFFTSVLNKALESTKTIMNIQV